MLRLRAQRNGNPVLDKTAAIEAEIKIRKAEYAPGPHPLLRKSQIGDNFSPQKIITYFEKNEIGDNLPLRLVNGL